MSHCPHFIWPVAKSYLCVVGGLNEVMCIKCLSQVLAQNKCLINDRSYKYSDEVEGKDDDRCGDDDGFRYGQKLRKSS